MRIGWKQETPALGTGREAEGKVRFREVVGAALLSREERIKVKHVVVWCRSGIFVEDIVADGVGAMWWLKSLVPEFFLQHQS